MVSRQRYPSEAKFPLTTEGITWYIRVYENMDFLLVGLGEICEDYGQLMEAGGKVFDAL